jgi:hypothetical protein
MKRFHLISFALGAVLMFGVGKFNESRAQAPAHVYEMRSYYAMPGKLEDIKKRFRDHTIRIFNNHNMKSVGYWEPQDNKEQVLIYMLEHPSKEEALKNWRAFGGDPEWQKVSKESEANGKLIDHIVSVYMNPSDFSPMK